MSNLHLKDSLRNIKMAYFECDHSDTNFEVSDQNCFSTGNELQFEKGAVNSDSHHNLDVDDDIFSLSSHSKASSLNSYLETSNSDNPSNKCFQYTCEEDREDLDGTIGVISPTTRNNHCEESQTCKNDKNVARSLFRTPSACATQIGSPTLSNFRSSPSVNRNIPTHSRHGTPTSYSSSSKVTPSRLKPKKADPLVLLHLNVMPLNYTYSRLISSSDLPNSLYSVRENWRLLQDKLGDTVIERGVLLAHPQESYETLEERLLEALELPVYPRARILKCGHYIGSSESEITSSDEEIKRSIIQKKNRNIKTTSKKWCDICGQNMRLQDYGDPGNKERRFCIKIYASNGLMSACAWAAAWREMERVDVEIEPYVAPHLHAELERLEFSSPNLLAGRNNRESPNEKIITNINEDHIDEHEKQEEGFNIDTDTRGHLDREKRHQVSSRHNEDCESEARKDIKDQDSFRQIKINSQQYEDCINPESHASNQCRRKSSYHGLSRYDKYNQDSLSDLFFKTLKITILQDKRNILLGLLSALIIFLAVLLKNNTFISTVDSGSNSVYIATTLKEGTSSLKLDVPTSTVFREITVTQIIPVPSTVIIKNSNAQSPDTQSVPESQIPDFSTEDQKLSKELIEVYVIPDL